MAFGFYSPISVNAAQVPSTQTDFPMLVSVTDARFKTVGNGGHVQNSSGFDIRPYSDSGLTTAITGYELERYNASTGEVVMWVKIASLSSSTTPVYLAYGDSGISTDGSSTTTWSNSFQNVYHLKDGTTLSLTDSTGASNGTNHASSLAGAGQIDGAVSFTAGAGMYIQTNVTTIGGTALTLSAWAKPTNITTDYNPVISKGSGVDTAGIYIKSNGKLYCNVTASTSRSYDGTGSHTLVINTWYYITVTYDSTNGLIGYANAASDGTASANGNTATGTNETDIGRQPVGGTRFFAGLVDEVRISTVARSANWITTEYNNQNAPGTFATLGTEVSLGGGPVRNPNWLLFFT